MLMLPLVMFIPLASCNKVDKLKAEKKNPTVQETVQKSFTSPEDAGTAFYEAAKAGDQRALLAIFGSDGKEVLFTGDGANDKDSLQDFVAAYDQMHRWRRVKSGGEVLQIGADNYPFPIPLGQNPSGQWYFDTAAGKDEILARRIGKNELTAITACEAIAGAQKEYFRQTHDGVTVKQYAQKFVSDPGTQNGLYWPATGDRLSPLSDLDDFSKAVAANAGRQPLLFGGYYYRILVRPSDQVNGKLTRGFAILAYPADYRNTGIMTFVVGKDGVVYQKDLGEKTGEVASAMTEFNLADGWSPPPQSGHALHAQR
jgi:hypothetical protein